jgi:hypothetical protein
MKAVLRAISPGWLRKFAIVLRRGLLDRHMSAEQLFRALKPWEIIANNHGYARSIAENECVDGKGNPIPWYAYPAIEQLGKWDFSESDVLEFGSGNSTLWWSRRAKSVTSIESVELWHEQVKRRMDANVRLVLSPIDQELKPQGDIDRYVSAIDTLGSFDVIIVDGEARNHARLQCASRAIKHLRNGGLIVVDNSDVLPLTCRFLREKGFHQIDFCGLVPLNDVAGATSIFFQSDFRVRPLTIRHPGTVVGGHEQDWESDSWLEKWPAE